jgi:membrane protease subunit HflK
LAHPDDPDVPSEQKIRRGVVRTLSQGLVLLLALAVIGGWLSTGVYRLELGEEAIILRLGKHHRTERGEGLNWHWPEPFEYDTRVNASGVRTEIFGRHTREAPPSDGGERLEDGLFIQTADKNIVSVTFDLQYTIEDAYAFVYSMADPRSILYEAAHASVRKVIGGMTVDEVLTQRKAEIEVEARKVLIETLASYAKDADGLPAFSIDKINLQEVQPPEAVRAAFREVSSAGQDEERSVSRAKGDEQEILEHARAEAIELREGSEAYKDAKILQARGEATRFLALYAEYARAPEVTRRRLYLETMQAVLPDVEKIVVERDTVGVLPLLPRGAAPVSSAPVPTAAEAARAEAVPAPAAAATGAKEAAR